MVSVYCLSLFTRIISLYIDSWSNKYTIPQLHKPNTTTSLTTLWSDFVNSWSMVGKGQCCICKVDNITVIRLTCQHGICHDDLTGYLTSALGDISMFPVKCPMHYEHCTCLIDNKVAKKVLKDVQYQRFQEFSDRAMYGDGKCDCFTPLECCLIKLGLMMS